MGLFSKSVWIFTVVLLLLFVAAIFSTPAVIGLAIFISSCLVIVQAFIILKDQN